LLLAALPAITTWIYTTRSTDAQVHFRSVPLRSAPFRSLIDALFLLLLAGCLSFVSCKR
jgi:hypothetical protein